MILQTKRVVSGGIGGFFGREGVEVTAAEGLPPSETELPPTARPRRRSPSRRATRTLATTEPARRRPGRPVPPPPRRPPRRRRGGRGAGRPARPGPPASPAAATPAGHGPPFAPGDLERSQAILEAARAAVRAGARGRRVRPPAAEEPPSRRPGPRGRAGALVPAARGPAPEPDARRSPSPRRPPSPPAGAPASGRPRAPRPRRRARRAHPGGRGRAQPRRASSTGFAARRRPLPRRRRTPVRDAVRDHLAARLPVVRDWRPRGRPHRSPFVGQTGVGKTSAAAASPGGYRAAGLAVALVAAGPGAHDALEAPRAPPRRPALPGRRTAPRWPRCARRSPTAT